MGDAHNALMEGLELKARELHVPFEIVSPQTWAQPKDVAINPRMWDALALLPETVVFIEGKTGSDDYTPDQRAFLRQCLRFGIPCLKVGDPHELVEDLSGILGEKGYTWGDVEECAKVRIRKANGIWKTDQPLPWRRRR